MVATALMAFLHHLLAFTLTACLVYEFIAYRRNMGLQRSGAFNGWISSMAFQPDYCCSSVSCVFFEKGINFYRTIPSSGKDDCILGVVVDRPDADTFAGTGLLRQNEVPEISETEYKRTRLLLSLEVIGIAVILLAAPMMARDRDELRFHPSSVGTATCNYVPF